MKCPIYFLTPNLPLFGSSLMSMALESAGYEVCDTNDFKRVFSAIELNSG